MQLFIMRTHDSQRTLVHSIKQRFFLTGEKTLTQVDSLQVSTTNNLVEEAERTRKSKVIEESREIFGRNEIIVKVPTVIEIFYKEVFNFFYVFQLFSVILWIIDEYVAYAMSILIFPSTSSPVRKYPCIAVTSSLRISFFSAARSSLTRRCLLANRSLLSSCLFHRLKRTSLQIPSRTQ